MRQAPGGSGPVHRHVSALPKGLRSGMTEAEFDTKDEAVMDSIAKSEDGDIVTVHEDDCAMSRDELCDCEPKVIVVRVGQA